MSRRYSAQEWKMQENHRDLFVSGTGNVLCSHRYSTAVPVGANHMFFLYVKLKVTPDSIVYYSQSFLQHLAGYINTTRLKLSLKEMG